MKTIETLQAGRAIAALAVVLHHAGLAAHAFAGSMPALFYSVLDMGYLGLDFFFVLSGFIIFYTSTAADRRSGFFRRRLRRIFVPYLPIGLALACAYVLLPQLSASDREWGWLATATLLPTDAPPALSVAWTLQHELIFYAIFAALLAANQVRFGMAVWSGLIVFAIPFRDSLSAPASFILAPINLEFVMGVYAAILLMDGRRLTPLAVSAGVLVPLGTFVVLGADRVMSPLVGLALAFAIVGLCQREIRLGSRIPPFLLFLGSASYALYLIHKPLLSLTSRMLGEAGWPMTLVGGIAASVLVASLYHIIWERPALHWFAQQERTFARSITAHVPDVAAKKDTT